MIYAATRLSENYLRKKYRFLFITSMVLGLFTVPTFVYPIAPLALLLFIYVLRQGSKAVGTLFLDGLFAIVLVLLCYAGILLNNDPSNLLSPNSGMGAFSLSDPDGFKKISDHLHVVFWYLFPYEEKLHFFSTLVCVSFVYHMTRKSRSAFLCCLSALMFFSPYFILMLHQVIPFERIWLYIVIPTVLCLGFIIQGLIDALEFQSLKGVNKLAVGMALLALCAYRFSRFPAQHRRENSWDHKLEYVKEVVLKDKLLKVSAMGWTGKGLEFYPTDMIQLFSRLRGHEIRTVTVPPIGREEILVIGGAQLHIMRDCLKEYQLMTSNNNIFLFARRDFLRP